MRYVRGVSYAVFAALFLGACSVSTQDANDAISAVGLKDVKLTGFAFWGCDEKDTFKTGFTATGADGRRVKGVVCKGFLKGATVRITGRA